MLQACLQEKLSTSTALKGVRPGSTGTICPPAATSSAAFLDASRAAYNRRWQGVSPPRSRRCGHRSIGRSGGPGVIAPPAADRPKVRHSPADSCRVARVIVALRRHLDFSLPRHFCRPEFGRPARTAEPPGRYRLPSGDRRCVRTSVSSGSLAQPRQNKSSPAKKFR